MAIPLADLITWLGYILYLLGAILLWVYTRDHKALNDRVAVLEATRPTSVQVETMIKASLYEDGR